MSYKIRVLVLNEPEEVNGVTWWRMYRPLALLARTHAATLDIAWNRGVVLSSDLFSADLVLAFRPSEPSQLAVLQAAREHGCRIIIEYDDDLLNIPIGHPMHNAFAAKRPYVLESLKLADQLWVSTPALAACYGHPATTVIPNAVLPSDLATAPNLGARTGVWRGDKGPVEDLAHWRDAYPRLLRRLDRFVWMGYMPTWATKVKSEATVQFVQWVDTLRYLPWLRDLKALFFWKPLVDNTFNLGKSSITWMEATCTGAVCVTNFAGKPGWENAVAELPRNSEEFLDIWQRSRERMLGHFDLGAWNEVRVRQMLAAVN